MDVIGRKYSISYKIRLPPRVAPRQRASDTGEGTEGYRAHWDQFYVKIESPYVKCNYLTV